MSRNALMLGLATLLVAAAGIGYFVWQDQQRSGVDITIGGHGVSIRER